MGAPPPGAKIHVKKAKVLPPKGKDFFRFRTVQLTETPVSLLLFRSPFKTPEQVLFF